MTLKNFPNVRVKAYQKGWVVEIQLKKWWGKKYWKHIVSYYGMPDKPWHFTTKEAAIDTATKVFTQTLFLSKK